MLPLASDATEPLVPASTGAQLLIADQDGTVAIDLTARSNAITANPGCERSDGWKGATYQNTSTRLPPTCAVGSANGLRRFTLRDRRRSGRGVAVSASVRGGNFLALTDEVTVTVVVTAALADGAVGRCGVVVLVRTRCRNNADRPRRTGERCYAAGRAL